MFAENIVPFLGGNRFQALVQNALQYRVGTFHDKPERKVEFSNHAGNLKFGARMFFQILAVYEKIRDRHIDLPLRDHFEALRLRAGQNNVGRGQPCGQLPCRKVLARHGNSSLYVPRSLEEYRCRFPSPSHRLRDRKTVANRSWFLRGGLGDGQSNPALPPINQPVCHSNPARQRNLLYTKPVPPGSPSLLNVWTTWENFPPLALDLKW